MSLNPFIRLPPITADMPVGDMKQRVLTELDRDDPYIEIGNCSIYSTQEYADEYPLSYEGGVSIGQSAYPWVFAIGLAALFTAVRTAPGIGLHWSILWVAWFLPPYLLYRVIPFLHRRLVLDHRGMTIRKRRFEWKEVLGTFVIRMARQSHFLIVVDESGGLNKFEITYYAVNPHRLAALVEYYRNQAAAAR